MSKYVLGMDGGGTKTNCALFDVHGNKVDQVSWGTTNHECMSGSYTELQLELGRLVNNILDKNKASVSDLANCVFGLAGVDTRKQHVGISAMIRELGIKRFLLCNDSFLGVKAGCESGAGICAINGTGFSVGGIDASGRMLQIGGMGSLTGDFGGGGLVARRAISTVYNSLFTDKSETLMTRIFFQKLNINSRFDFLEALLESVDSGDHKLVDFNRIVFEAARQGDAQAVRILQDMGMRYAQCVSAVVDELQFDEDSSLEIVMAGSVFIKGESPIAIDTLVDALQAKNPNRKFVFHTLAHPPVAGAIVWALEEITKQNVFAKVMNQFS